MKRTLLRTFAAAAAAAALSAPGFATTAAQSDQQPTHAELVQRWAESALDVQLKGMKTSLRLTDDQEKDWAPFETAVKDGEKARVLALQKEQGNNLSPMDRLNAKAERLAQSQADLEKIVEAAKPLYANLSDAQKHKFIALGRTLVPERGRFAIEMRHLRVGEGDRHVAPTAIGGKSAPSAAAASTPVTTTAGASGATSAPSQAASTPATTSPAANGATSAPSAAASAPDAASPEANGETSAPSQAASTPATTTAGASGATSAPSQATSTPAATTPEASGATSGPSEAASAPASAATTNPSGAASAPKQRFFE